MALGADATIEIDVDIHKAQRSLGTLTNAFKALAGAVAVREIVSFVDAATQMENRLRLVTGNSQELASAMRRVKEISNATGADIATTATLYQRLASASDVVGLTQQGVARTTELLSKALSSAGLSTAEYSSIVTQLSQAFNAGRLSGDEFRSVTEAFPSLLRMVAKEMGVSITQMKSLAAEGKITGVVLRDAFLNNAAEIEATFGNRTETIGQQINKLKNNAITLFVEFENKTGVVKKLTAALGFLANNIDLVVKAAVAFIATMAVARIQAMTAAIGGLATGFRSLGGAIITAMAPFKRFALIFAGLAIGEMIYDQVVTPLREAGKSWKVISVKMAEDFLNAWIQVPDYFLSLIDNMAEKGARSLRGMTRSILDFFNITPPAWLEETEKEDAFVKRMQKKLNDALTTRHIKFLSDEEYKGLQDIENRYKDIKDTVEDTQGELTKEAETVAEVNKELETMLKNFDKKLADLLIQNQYLDEQLKLTKDQAEVNYEMAKVLQDMSAEAKALRAEEIKQYEAQLKIKQSLEDQLYVKDMMKDLDEKILVAQLKTTEAQEVQSDLLEFQRNVSKEIYTQYEAQVKAKLEQIQLLEKELEIQKEIASAIEKYDEVLGGSIAKQKQEIKELQTLMASATGGDAGKLNTMILRQEKELRAEILKLIGDGEGALRKQQELEIDRINYLRDQQIINAEEAGRAVAEINRRYADEIYDYKIQKMEDELARELEMNGIRARINGKDVKLMEVSRDTAKQIARERTEFEKKTEYDKTQFFMEQTATVFNALGAQNRKAFEAAKAMNIAVAMMNTYRAATIALASYPPPFNFIAMAAAIATGLAQVAAIRSQQYSGRALGGGVMGGGSYLVGERGPEIFTPATNGNITRNSDIGGGGTTNVNFTIVANDTRGFDQLLTERRGVITQIIADANLERGRR